MTEMGEPDSGFREQARAWLRTHLPSTPRPHDPVPAAAFDRAWQRAQYDGGWAGVSWPSEFGGRGLSLEHQLIWFEETAVASAPPIGANFVGLNHAGPTLILRGTPEQQARFLPGILTGDHLWCQGFSEPGAGSDLASLRTRAVVDGDMLVVNGTKIWSSWAHVADYQELLVRTGEPGSRHRGLTWVIADMHTPGIEVRPIMNVTGVAEFCEVSYTDVQVPLENVVGAIDDGWSVAMATLSFERGTSFITNVVGLVMATEDLARTARATPYGPTGDMLWDDLSWRRQICRVRAGAVALRSLNRAVVEQAQITGAPGPESSFLRLQYGLLSQEIYDLAATLAAEVPGLDTQETSWFGGYLNTFRNVIAAGTSDIQKNIIAERLLGLPKD